MSISSSRIQKYEYNAGEGNDDIIAQIHRYPPNVFGFCGRAAKAPAKKQI